MSCRRCDVLLCSPGGCSAHQAVLYHYLSARLHCCHLPPALQAQAVLGTGLLLIGWQTDSRSAIAHALTEEPVSVSLQLKKIAQLIDMFANEAVDVLGVVDTVADSALIQTRDGKDVSANTFRP